MAVNVKVKTSLKILLQYKVLAMSVRAKPTRPHISFPSCTILFLGVGVRVRERVTVRIRVRFRD